MHEDCILQMLKHVWKANAKKESNRGLVDSFIVNLYSVDMDPEYIVCKNQSNKDSFYGSILAVFKRWVYILRQTTCRPTKQKHIANGSLILRSLFQSLNKLCHMTVYYNALSVLSSVPTGGCIGKMKINNDQFLV